MQLQFSCFIIQIRLERENKALWLDNLRAVATIAVIGIHVSSDYVPGEGTIPMSDFWIGNIYDSLSRFAVPVFVMISGALLLSKEEGTGVFLKKRFTRLLMPFIFWSLIYSINSLYLENQEGIQNSFQDILHKIFVQFRDGSSVHFWYIYMIIGLYLFIPVIGKWVRHATEKDLLYFLAIWFVSMLLNQPVFEKFKPAVELSYFGGFTGYLILGHYLKIKTFSNPRKSRLFGLILLISGLLMTVFGTYSGYYFSQKYISDFYEPLSPGILFYAAGLFLLFKDNDIRCRPLVYVRNFISKYSYGIFLVHVLVLNKLYDFNISWNFIQPALGIPVTVFICLAISSVIIFVISKLPGGKYFAG